MIVIPTQKHSVLEMRFVEFVFTAQYKHGFVWFSTLPGMFATEIVLEAYTVS